MHRKLIAFVALNTVLLLAAPATSRADWPQFRADAARTAWTPDELPTNLAPAWRYQPLHEPAPAWTGEDTRMPYDHAPQAVVSNGLVFFGCSVDGRVHAVDLETGAERWTFFTDGPVRFAPAVLGSRLYVVSDDGYLYCLKARSGEILWNHHAGPTRDSLIGNASLIDRWPARGGPAIADGVVYFGAGIWPSEGVFVCALDAETGEIVWKNGAAGYLELDQPHGGARSRSGVTAQGFLAVAGDTVIVPTGRSVPAGFDRDDGDFRYFHLQAYSGRGAGPYAAAIDGYTFNRQEIFNTSDGTYIMNGIRCMAMAAFPGEIVYAADGDIRGVPRESLFVEKETVDRKGNPISERVIGDPAWSMPCNGADVTALVGSGKAFAAALRDGSVLVAECGSDAAPRRLEVGGVPLALAAAEGRLLVGTDRGVIHCFAPAESLQDSQPVVSNAAIAAPVAEAPAAVRAAEEILTAAAGETLQGYCVDVGCGDGALAAAIARRSNFHVVAVTDNPEEARAARERLLAEGLYGKKVTVVERPLDDARLPNYFANLVVSNRMLVEGAPAVPDAAWRHILRPCGGVAVLGPAGDFAVTRRAPLEGSAEWTHQYCTPANTLCSDDTRVRGPLGMLWFADNDLEMPSRHGRGPAPAYWNGLLFVEGLDGLRCLDAYNGTVRWDYPMPGILATYDQEHINGVAITGSNFCVADGVVYVRRGGQCIRLDAKTGEVLGRIDAPALAGAGEPTWGYIALHDGLLYGSLYDTEHIVRWGFVQSDMSEQFSESVLFFALDPQTGEEVWRFVPEHSIRNNTIAIGDGRVFLIDRPLALRDRLNGEDVPHPPGTLMAFDAKTGRPDWTADDNIWGTMLAVSEEHDVLFMSYQRTRFALPSEGGSRMAAFRAHDGGRLWDIEASYGSRPMLNGRTIYAQPSAWDLLTGEQKDFEFSRSYGCGTVSGSRHLLAFRSGTLGYRDLTTDRGVESYGPIRPGCWINCLPAGGVLMVPEASNRCTCSYPIKATVVLQPWGVREPVIDPPGGAFAEPVKVRFLNEDPEARVTCTTDNSIPTRLSNRPGSEMDIVENTRLRARAFSKHDRVGPSPVTEAVFTIDPAIVPLMGDGWTALDAEGATHASRWVYSDGALVETSNLFIGDAASTSPMVNRPGTVYANDTVTIVDGRLIVDMASTDDDGFGLVFRMQDADSYYVWAMDRQRNFRVLARRDGDAYEVLDVATDRSYTPGQWYVGEVRLDGPSIEIRLDGETILEARDATWGEGRFGLYAWGCQGARYRSVRWKPADAQ